MLRGIRTASANWLGRIVMGVVLGLIAFSFAVWGIGDIFRGFGRSTVAKIGSAEISVEQFRQTFNDRLQTLSRQINRPIPVSQARALGLDRQILSQILAETALDEKARQLGLTISSDYIAQKILTEPAFRGLTGNFDRTRFEQMIRQAGFTEQRYVAEQRRALVRRQITSSLTGDMSVPKVAAEVANRYENEQRNVDYVVLGASVAGDVPAPTPEELATYFDKNKAQFRAPESRSVTTLTLTPDSLAESIAVTDADLKRAYEARSGEFITPERRRLKQMVFANAEEARAALERIRDGTDFAAIATERSLKETDVDLGTVTKAGMVDRAVADAAFSLAQGETGGPVQGRFGTVLIRVEAVEPEKVKPLAEVADDLKRTAARAEARARIGTLHDKIEDERAAGLHLDEVAAKLGLTSRKIEAIDRSGRAPDGSQVTDLPTGVDLVGNAFASSVGVENDPLQYQSGYVWYEVTKVTPSRERALDEVRERVETRWRDERIAAAVKARATELADRIKGGAAWSEVAQAGGRRFETAAWVKRRGNTPLPRAAVEEAFRLPNGGVGIAEGAAATEWVLLRVTEVTTPQLDENSTDGKRIVDALRTALADDLLGQYLARLETELGTSVNQTAFNQATGATASDN